MIGLEHHIIPERYLKYLESYVRKEFPQFKFFSKYITTKPILIHKKGKFTVYNVRTVFLDISSGLCIAVQGQRILLCRKVYSDKFKINYLVIESKYRLTEIANNHDLLFPKFRHFHVDTLVDATKYLITLENSSMRQYHEATKKRVKLITAKKAKGKKK